MAERFTVADRVICHCLRVKASQVQTAIDVGGCASLKEVMDETAAGGGCTACHRRILAMLGQSPAPGQRLGSGCCSASKTGCPQ